MAKEEFDQRAQGAIIGLELYNEFGNRLFTIDDAIIIINNLINADNYTQLRVIYDSCINNPHNSKYNHDKFTIAFIKRVYPEIFY